MALPIRPLMNAASQAAKAVAPHLGDIAQLASAAAALHGAGADKAAPDSAKLPGMPPQPSSRNATAQRLMRQLGEERQRMHKEAFERADATVKDSASLG